MSRPTIYQPPARPLRIAVAMGGPSGERAISLKSGRAIAAALRQRGHTVREVPVDGPGQLQPCRSCDVVFPAFHGPYGEDGEAQAELELLRLPYVGSGVRASRVAMDKHATKNFLHQQGTPVAEWLRVPWDVDQAELEAQIQASLRYPVVVKPRDQGSSIGVGIARCAADLGPVLEVARAATGRGDLLVERFVHGLELTVGVLLGRALPIVALKPRTGFFDYRAKYDPGAGTAYLLDPPIAPRLIARTRALALRCHRALGCRDLSRTDFILAEPQGANPRVVFLEINTIPGFTETSLLPMAAGRIGVDFATLCEQLVTTAWRRGAAPNPAEVWRARVA